MDMMTETREERIARKERQNLKERFHRQNPELRAYAIINRIEMAKEMVLQNQSLDTIADLTGIIIEERDS